jgi:hypothetical protein
MGHHLDKLLLTSPQKFDVMSVLIEAGGTASFMDVRKQLTATSSAGTLGFHSEGLERAGYIMRRRFFENNRPKTELIVTDLGREQFAKQQTALKVLAA